MGPSPGVGTAVMAWKSMREGLGSGNRDGDSQEVTTGPYPSHLRTVLKPQADPDEGVGRSSGLRKHRAGRPDNPGLQSCP